VSFLVRDRDWGTVEPHITDLTVKDGRVTYAARYDLGEGRPAVREALQHMHTMGLVTISHGERSRVNELSAGSVLARVDDMARMLLSSEPEQLEHLKQARRMFEGSLVRVAAENATAQDVRDLRGLVGEQRARIGDAEAFVTADMAFHARIAQISANPILMATSQAMLWWLFQYQGVLLHWSRKETITLQDHDKIVDLIAARDANGAVAAMAAHLDRSNPLYRHHAGETARLPFQHALCQPVCQHGEDGRAGADRSGVMRALVSASLLRQLPFLPWHLPRTTIFWDDAPENHARDNDGRRGGGDRRRWRHRGRAAGWRAGAGPVPSGDRSVAA
jgi:GntR family transcriptional regulator, sialic acid-inducible nan operon repressor